MNGFKISDLNRILERDAADTTYKFALLRALAYVCQRFSHFSINKDGLVWLPTGLLVERWLAYYYPLIGSKDFIPQKNAEKDLDKPGLKIAFRAKFRVITDYYSDKGGFTTF